MENLLKEKEKTAKKKKKAISQAAGVKSKGIERFKVCRHLRR